MLAAWWSIRIVCALHLKVLDKLSFELVLFHRFWRSSTNLEVEKRESLDVKEPKMTENYSFLTIITIR